MCIDIAGYLFATLAAEGIVFTDNLLRTIRAAYHRTAEDMVRVYEDDAAINGLSFDRHAEMRAVESFLRGLEIAGQNFIQEPISHASLTECPR
jgi:glucosyl-3-phosphoglycerate synthase